MSENLSIERLPCPQPGIAVLRLAGGMDGHGGRAVMSACGGLRNEGNSVVLLLHDVTFISSSGVGVLLALTEDFQDRDLTLRIAAPSKEVRMAIGLLNLDHYLKIHDTEEDALRTAAA
jgi:anti-anti-sigma factor